MAGEIVMNEARKYGVRVLAVDSEHSAIFQCLDGKPASSVRKLILTASGGPFRDKTLWPKEKFSEITVERALKHPSWVMGRKITIDSATLFNKGLEMIEARWLFDIEMARVGVVVHPQSIVHSMVEFVDGSLIAQLSTPDMCLPIQYALTYPDRAASERVQTNFPKIGTLTFEEPDVERFPAIELARARVKLAERLPAVLNAANEIAVEAFVNRKINFPQITELVRRTMDAHKTVSHPTLEQILEPMLGRAKPPQFEMAERLFAAIILRLILHDIFTLHLHRAWKSCCFSTCSSASTNSDIFSRRNGAG
jgi:1-deoxy-D-xylulose-5-phosphate reductoisomerase